MKDKTVTQTTCRICLGRGINHGIQVLPSKKHPTGWKSEPCRCQTTKDKGEDDEQ